MIVGCSGSTEIKTRDLKYLISLFQKKKKKPPLFRFNNTSNLADLLKSRTRMGRNRRKKKKKEKKEKDTIIIATTTTTTAAAAAAMQ